MYFAGIKREELSHESGEPTSCLSEKLSWEVGAMMHDGNVSLSVVDSPLRYKCAECGMRFTTLRELECHMMIHVGTFRSIISYHIIVIFYGAIPPVLSDDTHNVQC